MHKYSLSPVSQCFSLTCSCRCNLLWNFLSQYLQKWPFFLNILNGEARFKGDLTQEGRFTGDLTDNKLPGGKCFTGDLVAKECFLGPTFVSSVEVFRCVGRTRRRRPPAPVLQSNLSPLYLLCLAFLLGLFFSLVLLLVSFAWGVGLASFSETETWNHCIIPNCKCLNGH